MLKVLWFTALLMLFPTLSDAQLRGWSYLGAPSGIHLEIICVDSAGSIYVADTMELVVHRTTDNGKTWNDAPSPGSTGIWAAPSGTLISSGYDGEYRSSDHGQNWNRIPSLPITSRYINACVFNSKGDFIAATQDGIQVSLDDGVTWNIARGPEQYAAGLTVLGHDTLFAIAKGVFKSIDGGYHWSKDYNYPQNLDPSSIASDSKHNVFVLDSFRIYVLPATFTSWKLLNAGDNNMRKPLRMIVLNDELVISVRFDSLQVSSDAGNTWRQPIRVPYLWDLLMTEDKTGGWILIGYTGMFRSFDKGVSWQQFGATLGKTSIGILSVAPDGVLYGSASGGLVRSTDGGFHWASTSHDFDQGYVVSVRQISFRSPSDIAVRQDTTIIESKDGGSSWRTLPDFPDHSWIGQFSFDRTGRIFATGGTAMYSLFPDSSHWTSLKPPTTLVTQFTIAVDSVNNYYAIAWGSDISLWRSTDQGTTWSELFSRDAKYIAVSPRGDVVVTFGTALRVSSDNGATWTIHTDPSSYYFGEPAFRANNTLYFMLQEGLFESTNLGASWVLTDSVWNAQTIVESRGRLIAPGNIGVFGEGITNGVKHTAALHGVLLAFPNPAEHALLHLSWDSGVTPMFYVIYNALGRVVMSGKISTDAGHASVEVSSLTAGEYEIQLTNCVSGSSRMKAPLLSTRFIIR